MIYQGIRIKNKLPKNTKNNEGVIMKPSYSINIYDCDGDLVKKCLTIHIDKFAMQFQHQVELDEFIKNLQKISDEIAANYEQW